MRNIAISITDIYGNKKSDAGFLLDELKTGMSEDDDDNLVAGKIMEEFTDQEEQV